MRRNLLIWDHIILILNFIENCYKPWMSITDPVHKPAQHLEREREAAAQQEETEAA